MSYKHDPYTDSSTHINDEGNITISLNCQNQQARIVKYAELSDETIDAIADAVAAKMQTTVDVPDKKIGKWIPCKERLPSYYEAVLTWDGHCYCVEKRIPFIRGEDGEIIVSDWWVSDDFDEEESDYYPNLRDGAAIAWMPLPEPYKEEEDD